MAGFVPILPKIGLKPCWAKNPVFLECA